MVDVTETRLSDAVLMGGFPGLRTVRGAIVPVAASIPLTLHSGSRKGWRIADRFELGPRQTAPSGDYGGRVGSVHRGPCQSSSCAPTCEMARSPLTMAQATTPVSLVQASVVFATLTEGTPKPSSDGRRALRQCLAALDLAVVENVPAVSRRDCRVPWSQNGAGDKMRRLR